MRAALISIAAQPKDRATGQAVAIAGQKLAQRQLGFALAAGCQRIIALGDGAAPEAIALRHAAEAAGARFQVIKGGHGLLGAVRAADELLVLAPGLLAEDPNALAQLEKGNTVLVLPAGTGVAAGFERIDLERAWAGALIVPGGLVERLADLPDDSDPHAALLRIALQARVPERRLEEAVLGEGSWSLARDADTADELERTWLKRHLPVLPVGAVSARLSQFALRNLAGRLLPSPSALPVSLGGAIAALVAAVAIAWKWSPASGFALLAFGGLLAAFAAELAHLRAAPFVRETGRFNLLAALPWLVDIALLGCGVAAIGGGWLQALFPPLMLVGGLHGTRIGDRKDPGAVLGDRPLLALVFAFAAAFGLAEPAIMLAAFLLVLLAAIGGASRQE